MPFRRRVGYRPRRRVARRYHRRVGATLNRMNWNRGARVGQNLTRNVFWFKATGAVEVEPNGDIYTRVSPNNVTLISAFNNFARSYEQYKVLKVVAKFFPASVGSEGVNPALFHRGNICSYIDQPPVEIVPPNGLNDVMSLPSAKLFQPRRFHKRYINRPKGGRTNVWPLIEHDAAGNPAVQSETWETQIKLFGDNFAPGPLPGNVPMPPYFFFEVYFKVVFRSRYTQ